MAHLHRNESGAFTRSFVGIFVAAATLLAGGACKAESISLTAALANPACKLQIQGVTALHIAGSTACSSVTVAATDVTLFTVATPLAPVVIGLGGTLELLDQTMFLYASSFLVRDGGTMQAGTAAAPIKNQITISMTGNQSAAPAPHVSGSTPVEAISAAAANVRDITVMDGGVLALYGGKGLSATPNGTQNNPARNPIFINTVFGTKSWTYLARPAGPAKYNDAENVSSPVPAAAPDTTLTLATAVDWQVNDWISVATTSFSSHQTEIVQICQIASVPNPETSAPKPIPGVPATVSQLTLCSATKLKHYHYGGLAPTPGFFGAQTTQSVVPGGNPIDVSFQAKSFYDDAGRNYGIDERAEVALLSRNIKLKSEAGLPTDQNPYMGGHLVAMVSAHDKPAPVLQLVGVEIEKFGQALVGRYPVHLHQLPTPATILIQDVSVHHSYNKCFVVHGTANANFFNNVCVRTVGQGVYLEDGIGITGNQFMRNFIAGTMAANTTYSYPPAAPSQYWDGDNLQRAYKDVNWYTVNQIPDTSASGANGNIGPDVSFPGGFWVTNLGNTFVNNSVAGCQAQGRGYWLLTQNDQRYAYPEFTGNRTHGCYNGIDTNDDTVNAVNPAPTMNGTANDHAPVVLLNDNTVTRSRDRGFWGRGIFFSLHNNRFATNPYGFALLGGGGPEGNLPGFWAMAHQNVIAGMTRNNVERYQGCSFGTAPVSPPYTTWQTECTDVNLASTASWGNYPDDKMNIQGYSYYDGPARIEHNRFVNFRVDPTGIQTDPAARLLTKTDTGYIKSVGSQGQLEGPTVPGKAYNGYAGDPATGWIQSNAQAVPPTQYIRNSIWDNVDFKHQVYTEAVNMGIFNDGDKTTVILDKDSQLSGLKVVTAMHANQSDVVPVSLNNLDYYATDYTVDEPHSSGRNDFRATSLMSPHKYATLNIESVTDPGAGFRVEIKRDMAVYEDNNYPSLFLNGRGQNQIYEPFVMDRMGYTVYGKTGMEHQPATQNTVPFMDRLLFSYTDPAVKKVGQYFVNRIAVFQNVTTPANIKVGRIRRQWGQQYTELWPPGFKPPGAAGTSCDGVFFVFFDNQSAKEARWTDCLQRVDGKWMSAATDWSSFDKAFDDLMGGTTSVADFIANQTYYYDKTSSMLYFYMIEDQPVQRQPAPYGTCGGDYAANVAQVQRIKSFSDPQIVRAALDAACLVSGGAPQPSDLFTCGENGCAAYLVDFSGAGLGRFEQDIKSATNANPIVITSTVSPPTGALVTVSGVMGNTAANGTWTVTRIDDTRFSLNGSKGSSSGRYTSGGTWQTTTAPSQPHPISREAYKNWNQFKFFYGTSKQQPNGLPVVANLAVGNTAPPPDNTPLSVTMKPVYGQPPHRGGNLITYRFLPLSGRPIPVTENFSYRCVKRPPWSPVNARGHYSSTGGLYPVQPTVCTTPHH